MTFHGRRQTRPKRSELPRAFKEYRVISEQPDIRFGTDGWRAIIGEDYTFSNVRACANAVAMELKASGRDGQGVAVGYDTRFQSDQFAKVAAETVANHGIEVAISDRPIPTPALSFAVTTLGAARGIMITASHNPPEWNGFKVKSSAGSSATPEEVAKIEAYLPVALKASNKTTKTPSNNIKVIDFLPSYLEQLARIVDIEIIKAKGLHVVVDSMHGSGAGVIARLLEMGLTKVDEIRCEINPSFPQMKQPEPVEENLTPLISHVTDTNADIGIATDGDADRLGVVSEHGKYISTLEVFSMLFHHLKARHDLPGGAASTITMSSMMDILTRFHNVPFFRTPVGFKFVGPAMMDNNCVIGGEESGGYAFARHIPERDGPLSGLIFLESMAMANRYPSELLQEIHEITGPHSFRRIDIEFDQQDRARLDQALHNIAPQHLGGIKVENTDRTDGVRFVLSGGAWAVVRMSGTEPLVRLYAEASAPQHRDAVLDDLRELLKI